MKVILAMVASVDGKTTKWNNPDIYKWTSKEDQIYFRSLVEKNNVIIMGRRTFDAVRLIIKLSPERLRIVMTKTPEKYVDLSIAGQLEFTNDSPRRIVNRLESRGYTQVLLVGGGYINTLFFKSKLIDEVWLTIEPYIFGFGNSLVAEEKLNISFQLRSVEKLNKNGTILLQYLVK